MHEGGQGMAVCGAHLAPAHWVTAGRAGATAQPELCPRNWDMGFFFLAGRVFFACLAPFQVSVVACAPIHPVVCPTAGARNRRV